MKICSQCQISQPLTEYWKNPRASDGLQYACRSCKKKTHNIWLSKNTRLDYYKTYEMTRRKRRNPYKYERDRMLKKYGLNQKLYEEMFEKQGNACLICVDKEAKRYVVDHNHTTGKVRGILCWHCNVLLGHAKEDKEILKSAIIYLDK